MKNVMQILGVFFIGALIGFILMGFGLSVDISMMAGTAVILVLAYLVTKQNNKGKNKWQPFQVNRLKQKRY